MKRYSNSTLTTNFTKKIRHFLTYSYLLFRADTAPRQLSNAKYYINHIAKIYPRMRQLTALSFLARITMAYGNVSGYMFFRSCSLF